MQRGGIAVGGWAGLVAAMSAAGMDPRPVLLAALVGALVVVVSLVIDIGQEPARAGWPVVRVRRAPSTGDARVHQLHRAIDAATLADERVGPLRRLLATIVDERVQAHHGVDRGADPERFRSIVGADLVAWLDPPDGTQVRVTRRELAGVLRRIEAL
jgi:hypothetical protein